MATAELLALLYRKVRPGCCELVHLRDLNRILIQVIISLCFRVNS